MSRTADTLIKILADILPAGAAVRDETPLHAFGLDSLMVTRLCFEIQRAFDVALPIEWLAGCTDLRQLSGHIESQLNSAGRSAQPSSPAFESDAAARFEPFPLTAVQEAYLIGKQAEFTPDPVGCHLYREFEMPDLDIDRLRAAWDRLVGHHDVLRAIVAADGTQRVQPQAPPWNMPVHDLSHEADAVAAARREAVRRRMSHRLYEVDRWPGFTIEVTRGEGGRCVVHLSVDAMLTDGHGLDLLLRQWFQCYRQLDCVLPAVRVSLRDSILALRAQQQSRACRDDLGYWAARLADMPPGPALGWVEEPQKRADCGCFLRKPMNVTLSARGWHNIRARAAALNVSPTALVLTLFIEALARVGASPPFSLVVTTNTRARLPVEAGNLVGPFTDTTVFVAPDTLAQSFDEGVRLVHASVWRDLGHASVGGVAALRALRARDSRFRPPPLPIVFTSLLNVGVSGSDAAGRGANLTFAVSQTSGVFLDHQMWEEDDQLHVRWDVAEALFPKGVVETLFAAFCNALDGAAAEGDGVPTIQPLNELQRAYYVARVDGPRGVGSGCQVYHSFHVAHLDVNALERALIDMIAAYPALRSHLAQDGQLCIRHRAPDRFKIPEVDLTDVTDSQAVLSALRDDMAGRAFAVDRWPAFDLRVTKAAQGEAFVHCAIDLAIADGISIHAMFRELFRLAADPAARPRPPVRLGDAARTQARLERPRLADCQAYWQNKFRRLPSGPNLAPAGAKSSDRRRVRLAGRLAAWPRFKERARQHGVSPDAVLLAAFTEALCTRLGDSAFALPVVRWTEAENEPRPGEFTALGWVVRADPELPLPAKAAFYQDEIERDDEAASVLGGLGELRKLVMKERRRVSFGYPVVYTSVLGLAQCDLPSGVRLGPWMTYTPDVSLDCIGIEDKDGLHYVWDAVAADFPGDMLEAMFDAFRHRLEGFASDARERQVGSAPSALEDRPAVAALAAPLSAEERHKILYGWNDTAVPFPDQFPVHLLFERHARERPEAKCLRSREGAVTYGELNREANRIAWQLKRLDVGAESVVAISLRRSPAMVAALFGVLKAGAAYMPVDPALGAERAAMMLSEVGACVLICAGAPRWQLPSDIQLLDLERMAEPSTGERRNPKPAAGVSNTAYVLFTSGSTGRPKAVAVNHRSILNLLNWCYRNFTFGEADMGLAVTALAFDLSAFDLIGLLGCGASLYLADEVEQKDPALLLDILLDQPITFWNSAPSTLNQLAPLLPECRGHPGAASLRLVFLSGDYTPLTLPDEVRLVFPNARMVSLGGATEATIWSNFFAIGAIDPQWRSIPYGRPIDNARYHILDEALEPCAIGVEGDLHIGGECLSLGYLNQPGLTAERFIPDPFSDRPGQRLYRTGDRAAYFADGNICFLGRRDDQVKIRGFRVELGEIEHCLRQHAAVKDAVVLAREDDSGEKRLVAYVVAAAEPPPDAKALRAHAAATLPDYMVPNFMKLMAAFPATANGKLDRAALPWPLEQPAVQTSPEPAAVEALGMEIAALFAEKLGIGRVDPQQDLWDQGATSFTMVQVCQTLHKRCGRRVPVSALLDDPTAAGIARALAPDWPAPGKAAAAPHEASSPVRTSPVADAMPAHGSAGPPETVDLLSAADKARFLAAGHNLRRPASGEPPTHLDRVALANEQYHWRSSFTDFLDAPIAYEDFCRLLSLLKKASTEGGGKFLYPSAGASYAVQTYLHLKQGAVRGIEPGLYWYNPQEHALQRLNALPAIDRNCHFVYNRPTFDRASLGMFLIGQSHGIEPLYGDDSERFLLLEAGYIGQLLMMGQAACGIGLCPVGALAFDRIRADFALDDGHKFLHAFLGGPVAHRDRAASTRELPVFSGAARPLKGINEIAIIGLAGRYPEADDPQALWRNLKIGRCSLGPAPAGRRHGVASRQETRIGGFLADIDRFDNLLFHISPSEARTLDPQIRLLLQSVWECLENAGYTAPSLRRSAPRIGVFVGVMWQDYQHVGAEEWTRGGDGVVAATASDIANRISYFFDFKGPSLAVNTACASSLTALHLAAESLRTGECDAAVVGGVNLVAHTYHTGILRSLDLVCDGRSAGAFDPATTGWSVGEGSGALLLRPAASALAAHDTIQAVIETTHSAHVGHSSRFGAPDPGALADSVSRTLGDAGIAPDSVGYVECAAAGAGIADAAEAEALAHVFGSTARDSDVLVGTIKPNIGHLEAAAGLSQLTKVVLQLQHRQIAPTLISGDASPALPAPLRIADRLQPWAAQTSDGSLRVLVNSLGATGSYGHAVIRSFEGAARPPAQQAVQVILLSAASAPQLDALARMLRDHLAQAEGRNVSLRLDDVAFTLQTGRVHLARRLALICTGMDDLMRGLSAVLRREITGDLYDGEAGRARAALSNEQLHAVSAWLKGHDIAWHSFWSEPAWRVALPTYPFAQEPHWLAAEQDAGPAARGSVRAHDSASDRTARIERYLMERYSLASGIPLTELDPRVPLDRFGLNSRLITRLNAELDVEFGSVPRTLFFEHSDLAGIAGYLADRGGGVTQGTIASVAVPQSSVLPGDDIAIIGIAGRYPQAGDLDRFWDNLQAGRDCVTQLTEPRRCDGWPIDLMWGGFLDRVDQFDPLFFGISPREAELMDPQERLFLEVVWETLEDAGYPRKRLRERHRSQVGVFVGVMYNEYPFFGIERPDLGPAGSTPASIANRVSYFLDLCGPSMAVDTMCSASLTCLHLAVESLRRQECEVAIAGGVNLSLHPNKFIQLARMKMSSSDHRCRSFGAGGDGFVPGEGVGAVLLKPLRRAIADGDRIHAVIKATAVNHGGKANGFTVPNSAAQGSLIDDALRRAGINPATISYIETHGTGTALGDPVEINGLTRAFSGEALTPASCAIGSVKSNIGHLEAASGIAGLTKVVLQLRHGRLVPSLHAGELNSGIDWPRSPFHVQRELADWRPQANPGGPVPRRAGISSFGAGGSNAHVIVEGYESAPVDDMPSRSSQLIVLSAYDEDRLKAVAERLANFLRRRSDGPTMQAATKPDLAALADELAGIAEGRMAAGSAGELCAYLQEKYGLRAERSLDEPDRAAAPALEDISYTLQAGREAMRERLALVAATLEDLCAQLDRFCAGDGVGLLRGRAPGIGDDHAAQLPADIDASDLTAVGRHWVAGGHVDWSRLHAARRPRIVALPAYPFYRMRCWLRESAKPAFAAAPVSQPVLKTYRKIWVGEDGAPAPSIGGKIVCLYEAGSAMLARALAERLASHGVLLLRQGASGADGTPAFSSDASGVAAMDELLRRNADIGGWIDLCDYGGDSADAAGWKLRLAMLQRLLRERPAADLTVVHLVRGLFDLAGPAPSLTGARMAGFVRMLGAEHRRVTARVIDTDLAPDDADRAAGQIARELGMSADSGEICWRGGRRHVPRLREIDWPSTAAAWQPDPDKAYCVSGGTRGIGALVARHLVRRGVRRLVLLSARSQPPRRRWNDAGLSETELGAIDNVRELERGGAEVMHYTGPLTDRARLGQFLAEVRGTFGRIGGIIHCAGTASRGRPSFAHKDLADIGAVSEPKVEGLEALAELCVGDPLDFAVLFSSLSAVVPALAAGVSDYAAANCFMDIFAGHQSRSGRRGFCSVAWPPWLDFSRGRYNAEITDALGIAAIGSGDGLDLLDRVLADPGIAQIVVCRPADAGSTPDALLRVKREPSTAPVAPSSQPRSEAPPSWLIKLFSETLNIPAGRLDPTALFGDLGVESVVLGELLQKIEAQLRRSLEPSLLLDHPTLERLSAHLAQVAAPTAPAVAPQLRSPGASAESKTAVVGIACRLPAAPDVETFWANLIAGHCAIGEVPASRWDWRQLYRPVPERGKSISKWGGFVDGIETFDPDYFGMTDQQTTCLDPAIRLFLESAATCFADAGYAERELHGRDVGIFVGARMSDYRDRVRQAGLTPGLGGDQNFIAACAAHHFDLRGPNLVVDSACSSALVAVGLACQGLQQGQCELALAGGVEVLLDETPYLEFSAARALSPSGRCHAFDQRADGFVPGEGCGAVLLKRLDKALRDGDRIYAVIDAVAINNDGHTMGLTTPNPQAQARAVRQALAASGFAADDVGMVEAHGTATMIGDPIELRALTDAFREHTDRAGYCAIGSVKSNIGHLLSAAGIAGLLKIVLAIHHGQIPRTLFCETPNPRFDFAASPFVPNIAPRAWPLDPQERRVAGLSAFGLGGTNVHLVASRHAGAAPTRAPLPAPQFRRRRLWLEREPEQAGATDRSRTEPQQAPMNGVVASILDLQFERAASGAGAHATTMSQGA